MVLKSLYFLMISALFMASSLLGVSAALDGSKSMVAGVDADFEFTPINTKDPKVIELAKFAVDEYNKEHGNKLIFTVVLEATSTNDAQGTNYGLVVAATDNNEMNDYTANVLVDKDSKKLVVFKENP